MQERHTGDMRREGTGEDEWHMRFTGDSCKTEGELEKRHMPCQKKRTQRFILRRQAQEAECERGRNGRDRNPESRDKNQKKKNKKNPIET